MNTVIEVLTSGISMARIELLDEIQVAEIPADEIQADEILVDEIQVVVVVVNRN